jgi:Family of unknown function (DUF6339)
MRIDQGISPGVRVLLTTDFRTGRLAEVDFRPYLQDLGFGVDLTPALELVDQTMHRHRDRRDQSDAWLAPRLHAALRLTRRQAADKRLWSFLTISARPAYVRWRFEQERTAEEGVAVERFLFTRDRKHALARLWWAAELTRNGANYSPSVEALRAGEFINNWLTLDAVHHRPTAIAAGRFLARFNEKGATSYEGLKLAQTCNLYLTTRSLDALAPNPPGDIEAVREWCGERFDHTLWTDDLPDGPDEEPIPEEDVGRVYQLLEKVAADVNLAQKKGGKTATAN